MSAQGMGREGQSVAFSFTDFPYIYILAGKVYYSELLPLLPCSYTLVFENRKAGTRIGGILQYLRSIVLTQQGFNLYEENKNVKK